VPNAERAERGTKPVDRRDRFSTHEDVALEEEMAVQTIRVLLIEDNPGDARLLRESLAESQIHRFEVTHAESLTRGLSLLSTAGFDLVLLDLMLPDGQGLATYSALRSRYPDVPVVILSGLDDDKAAMEAVQAGAQDYLIKGRLSSPSLVRVLRYAIERHRMQLALRSLSVFDNVAALYNRIGFLTLARQQLTLALQANSPLALCLVSLDNKSEIGRDFGFMEADSAFSKTALLLRRSLRPSDILGHLGGDTFAVIFPGYSRAQVEAWLPRLQDNIQSHNTREDARYQLQVSVGIARLGASASSSLEQFMASADQDMQEQRRKTKVRAR
jgi:two-component system cell cycle response regulator